VKTSMSLWLSTCLLAGCAWAPANPTRQPPPQAKQSKQRSQPRYDPLISAIIHVESRGNPRAVSRRGARGLMQVMPSHARRLGIRDLFEPSANVRAGMRILHEEFGRFGGNIWLAVAAYNAGSPAVLRAIRRARSESYDSIERYLPKETRQYVPRVMETAGMIRAGLRPGSVWAVRKMTAMSLA
jgi:membrane-bound lytic murein transglycosylase MltF